MPRISREDDYTHYFLYIVDPPSHKNAVEIPDDIWDRYTKAVEELGVAEDALNAFFELFD